MKEVPVVRGERTKALAMSDALDLGDRLPWALGLEAGETAFPWQIELIQRSRRGEVQFVEGGL